MYIDITDIIEMTWVTLPWDGRLYELCWLLYKRCDHGSSDAVSFRFGQSLTWKKTLSFVLKPSTVMISNQFPVLFFKGLFWKRMQDVVEPTRFICFPYCFISFRATTTGLVHVPDPLSILILDIGCGRCQSSGGPPFLPMEGTHWTLPGLLGEGLNGLEQSDLFRKKTSQILELHHNLCFFFFPPYSFIL